MIKNLYAYTYPGAEYPGYISLNDRHGDEVVLTVRGKAWRDEFGRLVPGNQAELALDEEQLRELWRSLYLYLNRNKKV